MFVLGGVEAPTLRYRDATTPSFDAALPGLSRFLVAVSVLRYSTTVYSVGVGLSTRTRAYRSPPPPALRAAPRRAALNQSRPGHLHTLSLATVSSPPRRPPAAPLALSSVSSVVLSHAGGQFTKRLIKPMVLSGPGRSPPPYCSRARLPPSQRGGDPPGQVLSEKSPVPGRPSTPAHSYH